MGFLRESAQDAAELRFKLKQMRHDSVVPLLLEHCALAAWGSLAVVCRARALAALPPPGAADGGGGGAAAREASGDVAASLRLDTLRGLAGWADERSDECVGVAGAAALALAAGYGAETVAPLVARRPGLLEECLRLAETSPSLEAREHAACALAYLARPSTAPSRALVLAGGLARCLSLLEEELGSVSLERGVAAVAMHLAFQARAPARARARAPHFSSPLGSERERASPLRERAVSPLRSETERAPRGELLSVRL